MMERYIQRFVENITKEKNKFNKSLGIKMRKDPAYTGVDLFKFYGNKGLYNKVIKFLNSNEYKESVQAVLENINLDTDNLVEPERLLGTHSGKTSQTKKWKGNVFLNLYNKRLSKPEKYINQLFVRIDNGRVKQAMVLVSPKSIGEEWFSPLYKGLVCFTHDHLKLQNGNELKEDKFGGCFVYFGNNEEEFIDEFRKIGTILKAID